MKLNLFIKVLDWYVRIFISSCSNDLALGQETGGLTFSTDNNRGNITQ